MSPSEKTVKTPRPIKENSNEEDLKECINAALDPLQPIDIVIEETIPRNVTNGVRKKDSEFSLESPSNVKSTVVSSQGGVQA